LLLSIPLLETLVNSSRQKSLQEFCHINSCLKADTDTDTDTVLLVVAQIVIG